MGFIRSSILSLMIVATAAANTFTSEVVYTFGYQCSIDPAVSVPGATTTGSCDGSYITSFPPATPTSTASGFSTYTTSQSVITLGWQCSIDPAVSHPGATTTGTCNGIYLSFDGTSTHTMYPPSSSTSANARATSFNGAPGDVKVLGPGVAAAAIMGLAAVML